MLAEDDLIPSWALIRGWEHFVLSQLKATSGIYFISFHMNYFKMFTWAAYEWNFQHGIFNFTQVWAHDHRVKQKNYFRWTVIYMNLVHFHLCCLIDTNSSALLISVNATELLFSLWNVFIILGSVRGSVHSQWCGSENLTLGDRRCCSHC